MKFQFFPQLLFLTVLILTKNNRSFSELFIQLSSRVWQIVFGNLWKYLKNIRSRITNEVKRQRTYRSYE